MASQSKMASQPEKAYTCRLPVRGNTPFLRFNCPDWSKLDIIGQTIILAELTPRFGSFQRACEALRLQSNEVESFLLSHLHYHDAYERGRLKVAQWSRDPTLLLNDDEFIPQQRPVLVCASSIAPSCDFLRALGYEEHIPAMQVWIRRSIIWPPFIDVSGCDISRLGQADITFPKPKQQQAYSRYIGSLGGDSRAIVAFVGAWRPKEDGGPDTRMSFINVPDGSVAYGPRGSRKLLCPGRYYVCWPTDDLPNGQYNDFVLARNTFDGQGEGSNQPDSQDCGDYRDLGSGGGSISTNSNGNKDPELEDLNVAKNPLTTHATSTAELTVNPKDIFGTGMPDIYNLGNENKRPFHPQNMPQGPSRELPNPQLQRAWSNWPGHIFQFRLPRGYTILGPIGNILTFDPPQFETYDEMGNPYGVGGTYFIIPPHKTHRQMTFTPSDLPSHVSLRFKCPEKLVIIRNGTVLPRFVEPGAHEWNVREGRLDLYGARGCYDVLRTEGCYSVISNDIANLPGRETREEHGGINVYHNSGHHELMENNRAAISNPTPAEEALKILAPYRDWLDLQEAEELRLDREDQRRAQRDAKSMRDKCYRSMLNEERKYREQASEARAVQERISVEEALEDSTTVAQQVPGRRVGRKQSSDNPFDISSSNPPPLRPQPEDGSQQQQRPQLILPDTPVELAVIMPDKATRGRGGRTNAVKCKRLHSDEEEYSPTRPSPKKHKAPNPPKKTPAPRKLRGKPAGDTVDVEDSQPVLVPKNRQTRATLSRAQKGRRGSGPKSSHSGDELDAVTKTRSSPAAGHRKPNGPLLDAIQAAPIPEGDGNTSLHACTIPQEMQPSANNSNGVSGERERGPHAGAAELTTIPQALPGREPDETAPKTNV